MSNARHRKSKKKPDLRKRAQGYLGLLAAALLSADELLKLIEFIHSLIHSLIH